MIKQYHYVYLNIMINTSPTGLVHLLIVINQALIVTNKGVGVFSQLGQVCLLQALTVAGPLRRRACVVLI